MLQALIGIHFMYREIIATEQPDGCVVYAQRHNTISVLCFEITGIVIINVVTAQCNLLLSPGTKNMLFVLFQRVTSRSITSWNPCAIASRSF